MPRPRGDVRLVDADMRLLESGNFADATIVCGNRTWKVHKAILTTRCKWFKVAFTGNMAEAASSKVVLQEQDPELVDIMIRFIYAKTGEIPGLRDGKDLPALCVKLFRLADFFLIDELAKTATKDLSAYLRDHMEEQSVDTPDVPQILSGVLDSLREAYKDNSTLSLRQTLLTFICMRKDTYLQAPGTIALTDELPELGRDLLKTCLSVDLTTNEPNKLELPRELTVLQAVREGREAYMAGGPGLWGGNAKRFNTPCVLRPEAGSEPWMDLFKAVDPATGQVIRGMKFIAPLPNTIAEIACNKNSSIVKFVHTRRSGTHSSYVRFLCPADARHYVCRYRDADRAIMQVKKGATELEQELRHFFDNINIHSFYVEHSDSEHW